MLSRDIRSLLIFRCISIHAQYEYKAHLTTRIYETREKEGSLIMESLIIHIVNEELLSTPSLSPRVHPVVTTSSMQILENRNNLELFTGIYMGCSIMHRDL